MHTSIPQPKPGRSRRWAIAATVVLLLASAGGALAVASGVGSGGAGIPPIPDALSDPAIQEALARDPGAGAQPPGSAQYPVPEGAVFVDAAAAPGGRGTVDAPYASIQDAVSDAFDGETIVLRAGEYHESVQVTSTSGLTFQPYPGEEVWLDGSVVVDGWVAEGDRWVHDGWDVVLDSSPTFERGAPENEEQNWTFVDKAHPMAAHPDQVWVDGTPLAQVATADDVGPGEFAVDLERHALVVGADPSGVEVRSSVIPRAFQLRAENLTVRGIGIRRYAPSVPDMGAVTIEKPGATLEQVVVQDSSTTGIFIGDRGATLRNVTAERNGLIGISANFADGLVVDHVAVTDNNVEAFNRAPVAGGMKVTRSRGVSVLSSAFADNAAGGLWFDQSCAMMLVADSRFDRNVGHGLFLEISARAAVLRNVISQNGRYGMKVNDTSEVVVKDNVLVANGWGITVLQDERRADAPDAAGLDRRFPQPDPVMTWIAKDVVMVGNLIAGGGTEPLLWLQDYTGEYDAEELGTIAEGNTYVRAGAGQPEHVVRWQVERGDPAGFDTVAEFHDATGQEATGVDASAGAATEPAAEDDAPFEWPAWARDAWGASLD
ncbi:right-handed parallel beta-helix repeat-containing protein [Agromyces sp. MMS24-JH15]|uniref:right-handed parallel beta-helix repeat-containing protein n=1 Tax=Agromyces sp. MMS24-JH15 TaxID=3243765 RepID=UPI003749B3E3